MTQRSRERTPVCEPGVDARVARHGGLSYLEIPAVERSQVDAVLNAEAAAARSASG